MLVPKWFSALLILLFANPTIVAQCPFRDKPAIGQSIAAQSQLHCDDLPGGVRRWTITRPEVRQRLTEYPDIVFNPGESVLISARGCVNVQGGTGKRRKGNDWRRYVDPDGPSTDRSYHGTVWVPGARIVRDGQQLLTPVGTAPVRISSIAGSWDAPTNSELLVIPENPPTNATLRLGYEVGVNRSLPSDPYGRRAPSGHQCAHADNAEVVVTIIPNDVAVPAGPTRSLLAFDPVATEPDLNGFMLAPRWFRNYQRGSDLTDLEARKECDNFPYRNWFWVSNGIRNTCTQQASYDEPPSFGECAFGPGFGEFHGHVNWVPSTFVGKLTLKDHSADHDLDLQLRTLTDLDRAQRLLRGEPTRSVSTILTLDSQNRDDYKDALWLEFADYETIDHFPPERKDDTGKGWHSLLESDASYTLNKDQPIKDKTAVVTGLLDLDCVHECHTELHPVLAVAVRTSSEIGQGDDDPWMIFVRNQGNEGDCSQDQHYLDRSIYTMLLPAPVGAQGPYPVPDLARSDGTPFTSNLPGLTWSIKPSANPPGALVSFSLVPADACSQTGKSELVRISGVLHLSWKASVAPIQDTCKASGLNDPHKDSSPVCLRQEVQVCSNQYVQQTGPNPARNKPNLWEGLTGVWQEDHGEEVGAFEEGLLYNGSTQIQPNLALRATILATPVISGEVDGSLPFITREVRSTNGTSLRVKANDYLAGAKLEVEHHLHLYAELKFGEIVRSASSGFLQTPDFKHFTGHDGAILVGGGVNPGYHEGGGLSLRFSVGVLFIPATGEKMFRLALGPQYSF
jgi:hypothetical protein